MPRIFISYRRSDSQIVAGRIYDRLENEFGGENIFKDVDDIGLGQDFRSVIEREIGKSDVMLVIIGSKWLNIPDAEGNRRIDDSNDPVRFEIETGLNKEGLLIIPLLVDNASMPGSNDLPKSMSELAFKNAAVVRHDPDFRRDMIRLIKDLDILREQEKAVLEREKKAAQRATQKILVIGGGLALLIVLVAVLLIANGTIQIAPTPQPTLDDRAVAMQLLTFTAEAQLAQSATPTDNPTASIEAIMTQFVTETSAASTATADSFTDTPSPTATENFTMTAFAQATLDAQATARVATNTPLPTATSTPTSTPNAKATQDAQSTALANARAIQNAQSTQTAQAIPTATRTPRPTITPIPYGGSLFQDSFGNSNLNGWDTGNGSMTTSIDNALVLHLKNDFSGYDEIAVHDGENWTDYAFEARFKIVRGSVLFFIRCCAGGDYEVTISGSSVVTLAQYVNTWRALAEGKFFQKTSALNEWHMVRVQVVGHEIEVYIDDILISSGESDSLPRGTVGIRLIPGAEIYIDAVNVTNLSGSP